MAAIEKRGESSYRLTVSSGYDKEGKQIRKSRTIDLSHLSVKKQQAEAEKQFILFQEEIKKGHYVNSEKLTFEAFIDKWLSDYAQPTLAPRTLLEYKKILKRIISALGHIRLIQLQPTHLTAFYNNLREGGIRLDKKYTPKENFNDIISNLGYSLQDILIKSSVSKSVITSIKHSRKIQSSSVIKISNSVGVKIDLLFNSVDAEAVLSEKSILNHHRLITNILNSALQWGFILNNPSLRVKAPKVAKKEAKYYNIEEVEYILELIENEPLKYRTMITLALYGGMRMGELTALTWEDVDFDNCLLDISKSLQHLPGEDTSVKSTKTENVRIISIPPSAIGLLKEYKRWQNLEKLTQGNLWIKTDCLFTAVNGGHIFPSTVSKWFINFIRRHNEAIMNDNTIKKEDKEKYLVRKINFHGLRHTSASILINQNTDVTTVSKRLGHARTSTTMDIYSHSLLKADTVASDKLEHLFNKKNINIKQE
ncbi:MAG: site-specific integrase [Clostridiaceae bacterium]|nr:site-specific integrase [Clostridiaceae bacterium]